MTTRNLKRGLNRLFLVLTAVWMMYCLVVKPAQVTSAQQELAGRIYGQATENCDALYRSKPAENKNCWNSARVDLERDSGSIFTTYRDGWPAYLTMAFGAPPIVYAILYITSRVITAACLWVWRGFRAADPPA